MKQSNLDRIIEEVTARSLVGTISISIEKMAEEIAKDILADEAFRESLHALVRAQAKKIMAKLSEEESQSDPKTRARSV